MLYQLLWQEVIRHKGFIPWDDDVDLLMTRSDFEKFKSIFNSELGDKYILNAPNYSDKPTNRFAKILIKNTRFVEMGMIEDERACIKIDLFVLENLPENRFVRLIKGCFCNFLMLVASSVDTYEHRTPEEENFMAGNKESLKRYHQMILLGKLFAFRNSYRWFDSVDTHCQYKHDSNLIGNPAGTYHYFGVMMSKNVFLPFREVPFENTTVFIPNAYDTYLKSLFGNYMEIPPEDKREHHYIKRIQFIDKENTCT